MNKTDSRLRAALDSIRTLANEMRQRSSFRVTFDDWDVMPPDEIEVWQDIVRKESGNASYVIPGELVELYALTGGFDFRWKCEADSGDISGAIVIESLPALFQRDDESDMPMKECIASWRRFDNVSPDAYTALRLNELTCVRFANGKEVR